MTFFTRTTCLMVLFTLFSRFSYAQKSGAVAIPLKNLSAFSNPNKNWMITADVYEDLNKPGDIKFTKGWEVLVNTAKKDGANLVTAKEFGDVELNLDFMMTKSSTSGIYLEGRYGVKLADSWTKHDASFTDLGAIEQRAGDNNGQFEGAVPLMNVAKAPGLWQHLKIKFRAPVFKDGVKIKNARFEEVDVNGTIVQLENEVTGTTASAVFKDEKATGPLMFQGNGGIVAFRNISCTPLKPLPVNVFQDPLSKRRMNTVNPIIISTDSKPYLLRSFLMFNNKKRTHVISAGYPNQVNFSYDLKQGALFQVWRGQFLDVTEMWEDRGEPQLAKPLGSVMPLSGAPAIAVLADKTAAWPDSIAFDDLQNKGYVLDKNRMPTFSYSYSGADITDKIAVQSDGKSIERTITVTNGPDMLYCRIALAPTIEELKNGNYVLADRQYYIKVDDGYKPIIRNTKSGQELLVPIGKSNKPLTYSLTW